MQLVRKPKKKPKGSGHPLFIRLVSIDFPDFGSVGGVKNRNRKRKQKNKNSEKRRPQTLASLLWRLKTTKHDHQIDTNSINYGGNYDGRSHSKKDTPPNPLCLGRSYDFKRRKKGGVAFWGQTGLRQSIKVSVYKARIQRILSN